MNPASFGTVTGSVVALLIIAILTFTILALRRSLAQTTRTALENEQRVREAERASLAKTHFLATMSHEIRTPINSIIGYAELLDLGIPGPLTEQQRTHVERIQASGRHLLTLVNDILDLARIEAGRVTVDLAQNRLAKVVDDAVNLVEAQAAARRITLQRPAPSGGAQSEFIGDADRTRQILVNLLSNAVKFTEPGGSIAVEIGRSDDAPAGVSAPAMYVAVRDTGIGIPADRLESIFEAFVQVKNDLDRMQLGTGLGLTISRRLARLMRGELTAESTPGQGSTFTLWLPAFERGTKLQPQPATVLDTAGRTAISAVADALRTYSDEILLAWRDRMRQDEKIGQHAARISDSELEDHTLAFINDISQVLRGYAREDVSPGLLSDATDIRRVIATLHGAQRASLGFTDATLQREYILLRDVLSTVIRRHVIPPADPEPGIAAIGELLADYEVAGLASLRAAGG